MNRTVWIFALSLLAFLFDRGSKIFIEHNFTPGDSFALGSNFVSFTKVYNTGAAFGILEQQIPFLIIFSTLVVLSLSFFIIKKNQDLNNLQSVAIALILGGTAGNLFDRASFGYVIDFIKPEFVNFPVFNVADICINVGVFLILAHILLCGKNQSE